MRFSATGCIHRNRSRRRRSGYDHDWRHEAFEATWVRYHGNVAASIWVIVRGCVPLGRYAVLSKQASEGELHERDQVPALWPDV